MGLTIIPEKTAASIGAEVQDRPRPLARDPRYATNAAEFERLKDAVIALCQAVGLADGTTAGSIEERLLDGLGDTTRVAIVDDFDATLATHWAATVANNGTATVVDAPSGLAMAGVGFLQLYVATDVDSEAFVLRERTRVAPSSEPTIEFRLLGSDDEFGWGVGLSSDDELEQVVFVAAWDDGAGTYSYALAVVVAGSPAAVEAVTMPALAVGQAWRVRIRVTATGASLDVAADDEDWTLDAATTAQAPTETAMYPYAKATKGDGAGDRTLGVDFMRLSLVRYSA